MTDEEHSPPPTFTETIAVDPDDGVVLHQCLGCGELLRDDEEQTCGCPVGTELAYALGNYTEGEDYELEVREL